MLIISMYGYEGNNWDLFLGDFSLVKKQDFGAFFGRHQRGNRLEWFERLDLRKQLKAYLSFSKFRFEFSLAIDITKKINLDLKPSTLHTDKI